MPKAFLNKDYNDYSREDLLYVPDTADVLNRLTALLLEASARNARLTNMMASLKI